MKALAFAVSQLKRYPELQTLEPAQFSSHTVATVAGAFQGTQDGHFDLGKGETC